MISVKFSIGTPPSASGPWRRPSSGGVTPARNTSTPPSVSNSPLRRSRSSSPQFSVTGPSTLPAILGSPPKFPGMKDDGRISPDSLASEPVRVPFGNSRPNTVPENMATVPYKGTGKELHTKIYAKSGIF